MLRGLLANERYKVAAEDHSTAEADYTGVALMETGLAIRLPAKYTSDLIYVEEIR